MLIINKDRNILSFRSNTAPNPKFYTLDINTGVITGLTGRPLVCIPKFLAHEYFLHDTPLTMRYIARFISRCGDIDVAVLQFLDRLDSIGYTQSESINPIIRIFANNTDEINNSFRQFANDYRADNTIRFESWWRNSYKRAWIANNGFDLNDNHLNAEIIDLLYEHCSDWSKDHIKWASYYLHRGVYEYHGNNDRYTALRKITNYFNLLDKLNEKPQKGDFMRNYVETLRTYNLRKAEIDDSLIASHQNKQLQALTFSDDNFTVVVPMTSQEIITEGERQHNCVGRLYLPTLIDQKTHIVFVRKNDDLDSSYITCEVSNDGRIIQYLLAYNNHIHSSNLPEAVFRTKYEEHLKKNWKEA